MANSIAKHQRLLAAAVALIIVATAAPASTKRVPVWLRLYMHEISSGPEQTAVKVVKGPMVGNSFGDTTVVDEPLTESPDIGSKAVGRAQGSYVRSGLHGDAVLVISITAKLTEGPYNGNTIVIAGQDDVFQEVRELAVIGGTGKLRRASGHVVWTTAGKPSSEHLVLELDVHASVPATTYTTTASARTNVPVTPDAAGTEGNDVE